ncbi:MAG: NADH-quinone oxidoreductase subunit J [Candidatus Omnitrophica bacterium]|nr:NADH-quinone oxidoreductase subunit J [Candidatus Omnitrophota bacterium]
MTIADIAFLLIGFITLLGAFLAVWPQKVFYNALALILCLFGVACLFIYLNSEFLAVMEVIIYIGAIAVAILFAIMLSQPIFQKPEKRNPVKIIRAAVVAGLLFAGVFLTFRNTQWPQRGTQGDYSLKAIGMALLRENVLPFEAVSLVLLLAIIGALLLSGRKEPV